MESNEQRMPERISLSTNLVNELLGLLGNMPYNQSAGLIGKIQADVRPVVAAGEPVPELEVVPDETPQPESGSEPEKPM